MTKEKKYIDKSTADLVVNISKCFSLFARAKSTEKRDYLEFSNDNCSKCYKFKNEARRKHKKFLDSKHCNYGLIALSHIEDYCMQEMALSVGKFGLGGYEEDEEKRKKVQETRKIASSKVEGIHKDFTASLEDFLQEKDFFLEDFAIFLPKNGDKLAIHHTNYDMKACLMIKDIIPINDDVIHFPGIENVVMDCLSHIIKHWRGDEEKLNVLKKDLETIKEKIEIWNKFLFENEEDIIKLSKKCFFDELYKIKDNEKIWDRLNEDVKKYFHLILGPGKLKINLEEQVPTQCKSLGIKKLKEFEREVLLINFPLDKDNNSMYNRSWQFEKNSSQREDTLKLFKEFFVQEQWVNEFKKNYKMMIYSLNLIGEYINNYPKGDNDMKENNNTLDNELKLIQIIAESWHDLKKSGKKRLHVKLNEENYKLVKDIALKHSLRFENNIENKKFSLDSSFILELVRKILGEEYLETKGKRKDVNKEMIIKNYYKFNNIISSHTMDKELMLSTIYWDKKNNTKNKDRKYPYSEIKNFIKTYYKLDTTNKDDKEGYLLQIHKKNIIKYLANDSDLSTEIKKIYKDIYEKFNETGRDWSNDMITKEDKDKLLKLSNNEIKIDLANKNIDEITNILNKNNKSQKYNEFNFDGRKAICKKNVQKKVVLNGTQIALDSIDTYMDMGLSRKQAEYLVKDHLLDYIKII